MNRKQLHSILLVMGLILLTFNPVFAQEIGGNSTPLLGSVHTYRVKMGDVNFMPNWGLYPADTDAGQIEDGSATALIPNVDYSTVGSVYQLDGFSYWRIQFNRKISSYTTYVVGYIETTNDVNECLTAVAREITVQGTFDVDVALANPGNDAIRCGDKSDNDSLLIGTEAMQTDIVYRVYINYPADPPGYISSAGIGANDYWSFNFNITVIGQGGASAPDATIAGIVYDLAGVEQGVSPPTEGSSSYNGNINVGPISADTREVFFTVTYNEVLGTSQDITFSISGIQGAYLEPDAHAVNLVTHTIYAMPNVGQILAWE